MNTTLPKFVAQAILDHLRGHNQLTESDVCAIRRYGVIDALRDQISKMDLEWITADLANKTGAQLGLLLSLLRRYAHRLDIQELLRARWDQAGPFERSHLFWRLLDDPELPDNWQEKLFIFALSKEASPHFKQIIVEFFGSAKNVVSAALHRLGDPSFPESKKWAYVVAVAIAAEDRQAARGIVTLAQSSSEPFMRTVASKLMDDFPPE